MSAAPSLRLALTRNDGAAEGCSLVPSISSGLGLFRTKGIKLRILILVATISIATATAANAGPSRNLSLAANETGQPVSEQPQTEPKADARQRPSSGLNC